jgi:integrase
MRLYVCATVRQYPIFRHGYATGASEFGEEIVAARIVGRLKARQVSNAKPPRGKDSIDIGDGGNLLLQVTRGKGGHVRRSWVFKYEIGGSKKEKRKGQRHEIGLGALHTVSLAEARDKARALRQQLIDGLDPLIERRKRKQALIAERAKAFTFKQVAEAYLDLHLDSFKNAKHRYQWRATLTTYVYPKIGHMTVGGIGPADVLKCIEPIWNEKRETASRVRQRIKKILDYAAEREFRSGDNPAANITSLPKGSNGRGHHPALPYADAPAFMAELRARDSLSARALEFTILTAARTGEVIGATRNEVKAGLWTIPESRMKAGKEHRVPLCARALEILRALPRQGDKLFSLSNMAMTQLLKGMRPGVTVHGFRSTFMDWAHEQTAFPKAAIDKALAHTIGDKVEAAYRRGDLFEKRKQLMEAWARFCGTPVPKSATVVPLRRKAGTDA